MTVSKESKIQQAIAGLKEGNFTSVRRAAIFWDVPEATLRYRYKGKTKSRVDSHEEQQHLDKEQEKALCHHICRVDDCRFPLKVKMVVLFASSMIASKQEKKKIELGAHWVQRYLKRNPQVASRIASSLDKQRMAANDSEVVKRFCTVVQTTVKKHKIPPQNIWNMDAKGCILGQAGKCRVICRAEQRNPRLKQDGNREMVTDTETISAAGYVLPPYIIFKGKSHLMG